MASRKPSDWTSGREINRDKNRESGDERRDLGYKERGPGTKMKTVNESIVTATFNVTVPESTYQKVRSVYVTGTLRKIGEESPDWAPDAHQMEQIDDRHWTITISGPVGTEIEYKYTLGDWEHVEMDGNCADVPNRRVTLRTENDQPLNIEDTVQNWHGINP